MIKALRACPCCWHAPKLKSCGNHVFYGCTNADPKEHDFAGGLSTTWDEAVESRNESVEAGWFSEFEEEEKA